MPITITVPEAADYTFEAGTAPRVSIDGGAAYARLEVNVGVNISDIQLGFARNEVNVGVDISDQRLGFARNEENVGVDIEDDRRAAGRLELGDVDTSIPTPHLWYLRPDFGREGWEFKIVGHGFGATQGTYPAAKAKLNALECGIISWQTVAGNADALNANRRITPFDDEADPEHQEIRTTVPPGAVSGVVTVEHDA